MGQQPLEVVQHVADEERPPDEERQDPRQVAARRGGFGRQRRPPRQPVGGQRAEPDGDEVLLDLEDAVGRSAVACLRAARARRCGTADREARRESPSARTSRRSDRRRRDRSRCGTSRRTTAAAPRPRPDATLRAWCVIAPSRATASNPCTSRRIVIMACPEPWSSASRESHAPRARPTRARLPSIPSTTTCARPRSAGDLPAARFPGRAPSSAPERTRRTRLATSGPAPTGERRPFRRRIVSQEKLRRRDRSRTARL